MNFKDREAIKGFTRVAIKGAKKTDPKEMFFTPCTSEKMHEDIDKSGMKGASDLLNHQVIYGKIEPVDIAYAIVKGGNASVMPETIEYIDDMVTVGIVDHKKQLDFHKDMKKVTEEKGIKINQDKKTFNKDESDLDTKSKAMQK